MTEEYKDQQIVRRPLAVSEGMRRLEQRRALAARQVEEGEPSYGIQAAEPLADKLARAKAEADVVAAARRSQIEIRRHVDAYLKEHFEGIVGDVAKQVTQRVLEEFARATAEMHESQAIALDRLSADVRARVSKFAKSASTPKSGGKRAKKTR